MTDIVFCACTKCGRIVDLDASDLAYTQSKRHNYFWNKPGDLVAARCEGYFTAPGSQQAWELQEGRPYPKI